MTDLRKAAEMALDALRLYVTMYPQMDKGYMVDAREALRQALAQPEPVMEPANSATNFVESKHLAQTEQEPVAWQNLHLPDEFYDHKLLDPSWYSHYRPLYAAPPKREWVGLTDEELETIWLDFHGSDCIADGRIVSYERAIQAKLKEKNT